LNCTILVIVGGSYKLVLIDVESLLLLTMLAKLDKRKITPVHNKPVNLLLILI